MCGCMRVWLHAFPIHAWHLCMYVCMYVCMDGWMDGWILFGINHKKYKYMYLSLLKAVMMKNNYVCDVKYIITYTN